MLQSQRFARIQDEEYILISFVVIYIFHHIPDTRLGWELVKHKQHGNNNNNST